MGSSKRGRKPLDLEGRRFGRLLVVRRAPTAGSVYARWLCSCGCLRREQAARNGRGDGVIALPADAPATGPRYSTAAAVALMNALCQKLGEVR